MVYLSDYQKRYIIDCKLMVPKDSQYDDFEFAYPDGLNYLVSESWKYLVISESTQLLTTVDFF